MADHLPFAEVWLVDFEYHDDTTFRPVPICLVAREWRTGRTLRLWRDQFGPLPPYRTDSDVLFVAFAANAECLCHLALGWPYPRGILDLFVEHRVETNGVATGYKNNLLGALAYRGLDHIGAAEKEAMRALAISGGPWTAEERRRLHRGRYMKAVARMEHVGVPVELGHLAPADRDQAVPHGIPMHREVDQHYGVFEPGGLWPKQKLFEAWMRYRWTRRSSGTPSGMDEERGRAMWERVIGLLAEHDPVAAVA